MIELIGKFVEVMANQTIYRGKLVEVGEEDVYLESESGWVVIPVERVAVIREQKKD